MGDAFEPEKLGLKVGLEIHQQLAGRKLFCDCPTDTVERAPDLVVRRKLRASAGETGGVDIAAQAEQAKGKEYTYHVYRDTCCLVEMDEEPPHPANQEALRTAIMVAKSFDSTILPSVQFMRKTIVDGSNVSGFQRTGLFALGGMVPGLPVRIQTICVEEESARIVTREHGIDVYDLSRLGVPLIEIATEPDITTPEQAKEVAAQIGMVLRSTGRVKRGLGTIRQDLNVSIAGGARCEIKGAQDLRMIPVTITNEALRQRGLLRIKEEVGEPNVSEITDVTPACTGDLKPFLKKAFAHGDRAIGISIKGFKGILGRELCPDYRLGTELAGIARTWGFGGLIHSDENLGAYGLDAALLRDEFVCEERDGFLILVGDPTKATLLLTLQIIPRIRQLAKGIPQEVRKANPDGTSAFLRPMSSGLRMYPETDIPVVALHPEDVTAPKLLTEQLEDLVRETGLSRDLARAILDEGIPITAYKERYPSLEYAFLSSALLEWPREIETRFATELPDIEPYVTPLLEGVASGLLASTSVKTLLEELAQRVKEGKPISPDDILALAGKYEKISDAELERIVREIVAAHKGDTQGAIMGLVMARVQGRADGKRVRELLGRMI